MPESWHISKIHRPDRAEEYVGFEILNKVQTTDGHYITLKAPAIMDTEEIILNITNENFDWKINLEGSHDQKQWFSILKNYRILHPEGPGTLGDRYRVPG